MLMTLSSLMVSVLQNLQFIVIYKCTSSVVLTFFVVSVFIFHNGTRVYPIHHEYYVDNVDTSSSHQAVSKILFSKQAMERKHRGTAETPSPDGNATDKSNKQKYQCFTYTMYLYLLYLYYL